MKIDLFVGDFLLEHGTCQISLTIYFIELYVFHSQGLIQFSDELIFLLLYLSTSGDFSRHSLIKFSSMNRQ